MGDIIRYLKDDTGEPLVTKLLFILLVIIAFVVYPLYILCQKYKHYKWMRENKWVL
jgi:hypothetical protein